MSTKPKVNSESEKELIKVEKQFQEFDSQVKQMTLDNMNMAPKQEMEPQTKLSHSEIEKKNGKYLKPSNSIGSKEKFNEDFRAEYNHSMEYVNFIAENKEIIGEVIEIWTKPYPGMPAEFWKVPVNTPVWAPRHLAEQIKRARYHVLTMKQNVSTGSDNMGQYYGSMAVDSIKQRLDAIPVNTQKSIFMGAVNF